MAGQGQDGQVRTIASPKYMPHSSPVNSLAKQHGISFAPHSMKNMLSAAVKRNERAEAEAVAGADDTVGLVGTVTVTLRTAK